MTTEPYTSILQQAQNLLPDEQRRLLADLSSLVRQAGDQVEAPVLAEPRSSPTQVTGSTNAPRIQRMEQAIQEARWILDLWDDWDDQGSPGYAEATWQRAIDFLMKNTLALWEDFGVHVDPPNIDPGPNGSIDLHWQTDGYELLINVPADTNTPVAHYGDNRAGRITKGPLDLSAPNHLLLLWLTE